MPTPADQVVLASPDLVNPDLTNLLDAAATGPSGTRSSFDGNAQVLDHVLVRPALAPWSADSHSRDSTPTSRRRYRNDPNRPERLSDHDMPVAYFVFAVAPSWR